MYNTNIPELLVPAGDFDCLRAGVQNGADAIYFGSDSFSARSSATNFSIDQLETAINYCKIRNVKTNLTINTLITDSEFSSAFELAKFAYECGIDAIIVQDLGFAKCLIKSFPKLPIHASTQMSVHNLEGVLELEKLGFSRIVLSRELPLNEIEYIRKNTNVELEMFIHGALCISYSGQCLFSSLVGGRSGNRGKCAQPCRLPYELLEQSSSKNISKIDKGYLLSPRDLCSLEYLPRLVRSGINSFKIEGRMKTPEYVATVTRIYRKYIDLALKFEKITIDEQDKKDLLQVFNRGNFSTGHLDSEANKKLIFPDKSNNMGLYIGNISNYNANKGHITLRLNEPVRIGDSISVDGETGKYKISELMKNDKNIKIGEVGSTVKLGRMKGNIKIGSKVYKLSSKVLDDFAKQTFVENANFKKIPIKCFVKIKKNEPIKVKLTVVDKLPFYKDVCIEYMSDVIPEESINNPIDKERIISQFSKVGNTPYSIEYIDVDLDNNLHIASIGSLNNIRRQAIEMLMNSVICNYRNNADCINLPTPTIFKKSNINLSNRKISVLLENMNSNFDYSKLEGFDNIYIPLKFFAMKKYTEILKLLSAKFNLYVYMPTIIKSNYKNIMLSVIDNQINNFQIKGFVISNISEVRFLNKYIELSKYDIVANYTMNIFNGYTISELSDLGINSITPSVESTNSIYQSIIANSKLPVELIIYGRIVLMNTAYCLLGKTNKCYPECKMRCSSNNTYYLKDRLGLKFRIMPDNIQTVTSIYNSKITSIDSLGYNISSVRINILDENIDTINKIVAISKTGKKLEGLEYTNGNLNREI